MADNSWTATRGPFHAFILAGPSDDLLKASTGANGALAAATSAGVSMRRQGVHLAKGATSNGQSKERSSSKTTVWSGVPKNDWISREQSPSYAAAIHATSKTTTPASTRKSFDLTSNPHQPSTSHNIIENGVNASSKIIRSTDKAILGTPSSLISFFRIRAQH